LVEIGTSFLFLLCLKSEGFVGVNEDSFFMVVSGWILVCYLVVLSLIDIDEFILPNSLTYTGSILGLGLILYSNLFINNSSVNTFLEHIYSFFLALFGLSIFSYIVKSIIKKIALGGGDVKLFAMSGAWLGLNGLEVTVALSFLISAIFVLLGLIFRLIKRGQYIQFGPFICSSIFMVWFFGPQFWIELLGDLFWWKYL